MQLLYQNPTPSSLQRKKNSLMASSSLIFRRKGQKIIPFHRIKAGLPVCTGVSELRRAVCCYFKHSRGMQGGSKGSSQIGGVPVGAPQGMLQGCLQVHTWLLVALGGGMALHGRQVTWLLLLPQRQAVHSGFRHVLSLSLGFFIYNGRELA